MILSILYLVFAFIGDFTGLSIPEDFHNPIYRGIATILSIGYFVFLWWEADNKIKDIYEQRPKITTVKVYIKPYDFKDVLKQDEVISDGSMGISLGTADFYTYKKTIRDTYGDTDSVKINSYVIYLGIVEIVNNKENKEGVNKALDVRGEMKFYDVDLHEFYTDVVEAIWLDEPEPSIDYSSPKPRFDYLEIDIPANGNTRRLCVVAKRSEDSFCMAYSHANYKYYSDKSKFLLEKNSFYVKLNITGSNFDPKEFWFFVDNISENDSFNIRELEDRPEN